MTETKSGLTVVERPPLVVPPTAEVEKPEPEQPGPTGRETWGYA